MSKLSNLIGKSKIYNIGGLELEFKPRKMGDLDLLAELEDPEKRTQAMKKLIAITLKEAVPDATDEEIAEIAVEHLEEIGNAIGDVNKLKPVKNVPQN